MSTKILVVVCLSILIAGWLPINSLAASTNPQPAAVNGGPNFERVLNSIYVNVQNARGNQLPKPELDKLITSFRRQGWTPSYPIFREPITGILSLVFTRWEIYKGGVFFAVMTAGTYWDATAHCIKIARTGKPLPGWSCNVRVNAGKGAGLASLRADVGSPGRVVPQVKYVNVTGARKQLLSQQAINQLKRVMSKDGWNAVGSPILRGGVWLLKFSRTLVYLESGAMFVLVPGMYWDAAGQCARWRNSGAPVNGMQCQVKA